MNSMLKCTINPNTANSKNQFDISRVSPDIYYTDLYPEIGCCDDDTIWLISVDTTQCDLPDTWRAQVKLELLISR